MSNRKIATLSDFNNKSNHSDQNDEHEEGSEPKQQSFFAGGGINILQPPTNNPARSLLSSIFSQAAQQPPQPREDENAAEGGESGGAAVAVRNIVFWRNGFTILAAGEGESGGGGGDDEPVQLFDYADPTSQELLEQIQSGSAPLHVMKVKKGERVECRIAHKMEEDYVPPKPKMKPFSGAGQRLGAPVPAATTSNSSSAKTSTSASPTKKPIHPVVDEAKPTTTISIRLANGGERVTLKLNTSSPISAIRTFVSSFNVHGNFDLLAGYPPKAISEDGNATIESAGLLNAAIVQKMK